MEDYSGYGWIKVKRYVDEPSLTWEERYTRLNSHHTKETTFLINKVRELAKELNEIKYPPQPTPITKEMIEKLEAKIPGIVVGNRNSCDAKGHGVTQQFTEVWMNWTVMASVEEARDARGPVQLRRLLSNGATCCL